MALHQISIPAIYGDTYKAGDIGFTFTNNSFISNGIVFFTGWQASSRLKVSHSLIITGENRCIEALNEGMVESCLRPRFLDPHVHVVIRRPKELTEDKATAITDKATKMLGIPYDFRLIAGMVLANSPIVRCLPRDWYMAYRQYVCQQFHTLGHLICAGGCDKALSSVPEYDQALTYPYYVEDPQSLFENSGVFKLWKPTYVPNSKFRVV